MGKRIILFRHGKSDWDANSGSDHERPVSKRGVKAAKIMGQVLALADQVPDLVVTSSAVRARTTVEIAAEAGNWDCPVQVTDALYETSTNGVIEQIRAIGEDVSSVLLAGHEPTWSMLLSALIGGASARFPTAAMACVEAAVSNWRDVEVGCGELSWLLPPKFFTEGQFEFAR